MMMAAEMEHEGMEEEGHGEVAHVARPTYCAERAQDLAALRMMLMVSLRCGVTAVIVCAHQVTQPKM